MKLILLHMKFLISLYSNISFFNVNSLNETRWNAIVVIHVTVTEGVVPASKSPLDAFLTPKLPVTVSVQDSSLSVLCLLRVLHALNRFWYSLYSGFDTKPILQQQVK